MMRLKMLLSLCALTVLLGGCQSGGLSESAASESGQAVRALTAADNGTTLSLRVGESLSVALSGNASTGYSWSLKHSGAPVLVQSGTAAAEASATGLVGAPEVTTWNFTAQQAGDAALQFEYRRPWEKDAAPAQAFAVTVSVSE